jgi:rod shape-determining protein MreB
VLYTTNVPGRGKLENLDRIIGNFYWEIGVDLGSSNTLICLKDKGIIINEPTLIARHKKKRWVGLSAPKTGGRSLVAWGQRAKKMQDREPRQIEVIAPVRNGIISDLEAVEVLVGNYLRIVAETTSKYPKFLKPRVVAGVPCSITEVQKRAVKSVFLRMGAARVTLIEDAVLAALGMGLPVENSAGLVVVDVGGGKTEVSVVSLGGVVISRGIEVGGEDMDAAIANYLKMKYGLLVGNQTAETVKMEIGNLGDKREAKSMIVRGRDLETGLPKSIKLTEGEVMEALMMVVPKIVRLVRLVLDETPPELVEDVLKRGIMVCGKGALLRGLDKVIEAETKIMTRVAGEADLAVIKGCQKLLDNPEMFSRIKLVLGV